MVVCESVTSLLGCSTGATLVVLSLYLLKGSGKDELSKESHGVCTSARSYGEDG